jgi:hypothetical protein
MLPLFDERQRRILLATEAIAFGRGGVKAVSELAGVSRLTIIEGKQSEQRGSRYLAGWPLQTSRCRKKVGSQEASGIRVVQKLRFLNNSIVYPEMKIPKYKKSVHQI